MRSKIGALADTMEPWPHGTLLGTLHPDQSAALIGRGTRRVFEPGETLLMEGDSTTEVVLVLAGWVKVVGNSAGGRITLLSIRTRGDVLGELAALENEPRAASAIAATRVAAQVIGQTRLLAFLHSNPAVAVALSRSISAKMRSVTRHRIGVTGAAVLQRLAWVLEYLADTYAVSTPDGLRIDVPLSRADLAALSGAAEPSLYRALAYLRDHGILDTQDQHQIIREIDVLRRVSREGDLGAVGP